MSALRDELDALLSRDRVDVETLDALWARLPPAQLDDLWGSWRGRGLATGHYLSKVLAKTAWVGKRFVSPLDVQPLVCRSEEGLFSNVELGKGEASAWMIAFRGEVTATMVYDGAPTFDHFKRVDARTLLGIMNGKGVLHDGKHFYFVLEREETPFALAR